MSQLSYILFYYYESNIILRNTYYIIGNDEEYLGEILYICYKN